MTQRGDLSPTEPRSYRIVSLVLDRILARARWVLFPFGLARRIGELVHRIFWLLCNEHAKSKFARCGNGVRIYGRFTVSAPGMLEVADNVHINSGAFFRAEGGLRIDDNVHISRNLLVYTIKASIGEDALTVGRIFRSALPYWLILLGGAVAVAAMPGLATVLVEMAF